MSTLNHEEKAELSVMLMALLNSWGISNADKVELLDLPSGTKPRAIVQYQQGMPLPDSEAVQVRVEHLVGIAEALRLAYPRNAQGASLWLNRPNKRFSDRTPLAAMLEDGLRGITAVRIHIDCSYDWHMDTQRSRSQTPQE
jgi:hypothetical protein